MRDQRRRRQAVIRGPCAADIPLRPAMIPALTHRAYNALWLMLVLLHIMNVMFLSALAVLYAECMIAGSLMNELISTYDIGSAQNHFLKQYHLHIAVTYAVLAVVHLYSPLRSICLSLRKRQLVLQAQVPSRVLRKRSVRTRSCDVSGCNNLFGKLLALISAVNVAGPWFPVYLLAIEICEVALQTAQGYRFSLRAGNIPINVMFGVLICLNCCSTPFALYACRTKKQQEALARFACVVIDGVLDFVWGAAFHGYTLTAARKFSNDADREGNKAGVVKQVLVLSPANLVFSIFPFLTAMLALSDIRETLANAQIVSTRVQPSTRVINVAQKRQKQSGSSLFSIERLHVVLGGFGIGILVASLVSVGLFSPPVVEDPHCHGLLFPWGHTPMCGDYTVNCTDLQLTGRQNEILAALQDVKTSVIYGLSFASCSSLEMAASLGQFHNLESLTISDSTIVSWPNNASLTILVPRLSHLSLYTVTWQSLPTGLTRLPASVTMLWLFDVPDASRFLDVAEYVSHSITAFLCSYCNLDAIHPPVFEMNNLESLFLDGNFLEFLPDHALGTKRELRFLTFAANPMTELPSTIWIDLPDVLYVDMQFTNLSSVPQMTPVPAQAAPVVFASSTPLCDDEEHVADGHDWPVVQCDCYLCV